MLQNTSPPAGTGKYHPETKEITGVKLQIGILKQLPETGEVKKNKDTSPPVATGKYHPETEQVTEIKLQTGILKHLTEIA